MTRSLIRNVSTVILTATVFSAPAVLAADDANAAAQSTDKLVTEFRGRPPFKRELMSSEEIAALARFEETVTRPTSDTVRVAEFRGRPPFKREVLTADEFVELARFEETSSSDESGSRRRGAPGKPNFRR